MENLDRCCVGCKGTRTTTFRWEENGVPVRETVEPCIVCGGSGVQPDLSKRYRGPITTAIEDEAKRTRPRRPDGRVPGVGPEMTEHQLSTLRHMLGVNDNTKRQQPYRNYAAVTPNDPHYQELARLGMVEMYAVDWAYHWYRTTDAGRVAALQSQKQRLVSKSKRVYLAYLSVRDAFNDLTFKRFLVEPEFAECRRRA